MNILVTINKSYIKHLKTLISSIKKSNPKELFKIYLFHRDLSKKDINSIKLILNENITLFPIKIQNEEINNYPVYEERYPVEIYFRIFASIYLPKDVDRILYLDTDIIVINKLNKLYNMDFEDNYYIASTNIGPVMHKFNELRLGLGKKHPYINSGVLLINIQKLRNIEIKDKVNNFIKKKKNVLMLPDQDIISALYGSKIKVIDNLKYNLSDKSLNIHNLKNFNNKIDLEWIRKNTTIIHYYGKNKPWNKNYKGILNCFYNEVAKELEYEKI